MISKLLRKNISVVQFVAYALANLVGMAILLTSVQFYRDVRAQRSGGSDAAGEYLVLSKPVPMLSIFGGNQTAVSFSADEIDDLQSQPWVRKLGKFAAADYNVVAAVDFAGKIMSTAMFFESLPDEFVDIPLDNWTFDPDKPQIPVLIPRDYLALYNFGFASSRGMPQLSENLIAQIPLKVELSGNGRRDVFDARIVGLSSRLNTIAVPDEFMKWANSRYGSGSDSSAEPSRLIVELSTPGDPAVAQWLDSHGIELSADKLNSGKTAYIAAVASAVVGGVGLVISLLSLMILVLSIYLLIQKNREKIRDLILLGYAPSALARFYDRIVIGLNLGVTVGSVVLMLSVARLWRQPLAAVGIEFASPWPTLLLAIAIMLAVTAVSCLTVRRTINRAKS